MPQIKRKKASATNAPRVLGELSGMTSEQIRAILKRKEQASGIGLSKIVKQQMRFVNEQSRILGKQTELSAAQMLAHFDI